ncbi:hypothetical protein ACFL46_02675 [Candidatus Neomarinimicrobiota bacterium]
MKNFIIFLSCISIIYSQADSTRDFNYKYDRCLKTGRILGVGIGSTMGLAQIYWSATNMSGVHGPLWKNIVTGVPSSIIGGYVGYRTSEWATEQILRGNPKLGQSILKGTFYGAIDGAITFTASMMPLLVIGHYMDTIHFNFNKKLILLKLIGASVLGGVLYGGTIGATIGIIYGPSLSIYMQF